MCKKTLCLILLFIMTGEILFQNEPLSSAAASNTSSIITNLSYYENNEFFLAFKDNTSKEEQATILTYIKKYQCYVKETIDCFYFLSFHDKGNFSKAIKYLKKQSWVLILQPNFIYKNQNTSYGLEDYLTPTTQDLSTTTEEATTIPPAVNDSSFSHCWYLNNTGNNITRVTGKPSYDLNILPILTGATNATPITIAIIDTGVQVTHEDLADHIWINPGEIPGNGIDDDKNGYIDDINGWDFYHNDNTLYATNPQNKAYYYDNDDHGTHVAGIIAATSNNSLGIAGVASNYNVRLMSLKILGGQDNGSTATAVKAIKYAEKMGVTIANCSWNFILKTEDPLLKRTIHESKIMFVCSAGNKSTNLDTSPSYPASYNFSNIISVAATDPSGNLASYSNYGKSVTTAAPGTYIYSTVVGGYEYLSGTSMATPMVTGILAMLYANNSTLYPTNYKAIIRNSILASNPLPNVVGSNGSIDASVALNNLLSYQLTADNKKPTIKTKTKATKTKVTLKLTITDKGGSKLLLVRYAYGKRKKSYFKQGRKGKKIDAKTTLTTKKNKTVTIYAMDRAGNSKTKVIKLKKKASK